MESMGEKVENMQHTRMRKGIVYKLQKQDMKLRGPLGQIAYLSTVSLRRAVVATLIPCCAPTQPSEGERGGGHYPNKLKSTPYQEAFR